MNIDKKDKIIIELITKTQGFAYRGEFGVCCFCGGGRQFDEAHPNLWKPKHHPDCLYARAEAIVLASTDEVPPELDFRPIYEVTLPNQNPIPLFIAYHIETEAQLINAIKWANRRRLGFRASTAISGWEFTVEVVGDMQNVDLAEIWKWGTSK